MACLIFAIIAIPLFWYSTKPPEPKSAAVKVTIQNRDHVATTNGVVYNSNPPTSGPHFTDWHKDWKFYDIALPTGGLIHNMEHGGVVVWYKSSVDSATKDRLKEFTENNFKIIASVNEDIPAPIALSAWGVYELFDVFDEAKFKRFYKKNLNRGPENVYP